MRLPLTERDRSFIHTHEELGQLVGEGVPMLQALRTVAEFALQREDERSFEVFQGILVRVTGGSSLGSCLERYGAYFDECTATLIVLGEMDGTLDTALERVARLGSRGMEYVFWLQKAYGWDRADADSSAFAAAIRERTGMDEFDALHAAIETAWFLEHLHQLLAANRVVHRDALPLERLVQLAADAVGSEDARRSFTGVRESVARGVSLAVAFRGAHQWFSADVIRLVELGEEIHQLDRLIGVAADMAHDAAWAHDHAIWVTRCEAIEARAPEVQQGLQ